MKKVTAVLLGAGARGTIYARYALEKPEEFEIVAVAESDAERRRAFARSGTAWNCWRRERWQMPH